LIISYIFLVPQLSYFIVDIVAVDYYFDKLILDFDFGDFFSLKNLCSNISFNSLVVASEKASMIFYVYLIL